MATSKKDIEKLEKVIADPRTGPEEKKRFQRILDALKSGTPAPLKADPPKSRVIDAIQDTGLPRGDAQGIFEAWELGGGKISDHKGKSAKEIAEIVYPKTKAPNKELGRAKAKDKKEAPLAEKVMGIYSSVTAGMPDVDIYADQKAQKELIKKLDSKISESMFKGVNGAIVFDILEDDNYHILNNYLALRNLIKREGYNAKPEYIELYKKHPDKFLNPDNFEELKPKRSHKKKASTGPEKPVSAPAGLPSCDELIEKFKVAKKARLERQKLRKDDSRKPDTKLRDEADKKMTDIINKIIKLSKKDQLSKRVKKDVLEILREGITHVSKV